MDQRTPQTKPFLKNPFIYSGLVLVVVAAYVLFVLLSRYESDRTYQRQNARRAAEQQRESDRNAIEQLGGSDLAIRAFYVAPAEIRRGGTAQICYDVANAKTVTLDPPAGEVWPSHDRCLDVSPAHSTSYTLTISDSVGKTASQAVELQVK